MKELLIGFGGAALGFASGLLVPWVKWEIEKRQKRLETRRELVLAWRRAIEPIDFSCD